jgi:large subunit ribosomal protein L4
MNKKERRKALFCVLSSKVQENKLVVVDDLKFKNIATKNMVKTMDSLPYERNALLVIPSKNEIIERSASNLPYVKTILSNYLNIADLLKYNTLILLKDSLQKMEESFVK